MTRDDAVARDNLLLYPEVAAAMRDQLVDFFEGARIEEQLDPLARRQLAGRAVAIQPILTAAEFGPLLELAQEFFRFHRDASPEPGATARITL